MEFGPYTLDIINDGNFWLDGGSMFGVVPKTLWSRLIESDEHNRIRVATNCLLVRSSSGTVLIETGLGDHYDEKQHKIYSFEFDERLPGGLSRLGVAPEDVDVVIQTHLHFDHCGSLAQRAASGGYTPTFPRAELVVQSSEWQDALNPDFRSKPSFFPKAFYRSIEKAGLLRLVEGKEEVVPGISVMPMGGHTRGHQIVEIRHGDQRVFYLGDFIPMSSQVHAPYIAGYDLFPLTTLEHKLEFVPPVIENGWIVVFEHDTSVPLATLHEENGRPIAKHLENQ